MHTACDPSTLRDQEFKVILSYIASLRLALAAQGLLLPPSLPPPSLPFNNNNEVSNSHTDLKRFTQVRCLSEIYLLQ